MNNRDSDMALETFKAHLDFLPEIQKEMNSQGGYTASFFGGEPLLNFTLIEQAVDVLSRDHNCTFMMMPTNGLLLTKEIVDWFQANKVHISWSFDGLWHHNHNQLEMFKKTRELLPNHTCKAIISPKRHYSLAQNFVWFLEEMNMPFVDFSLARDDVWSKEDLDQYKAEIKQLADLVIVLNKEGRLVFPAPFSLYILDSLVGKKFGKRNFGCFSGCTGAGFMPDGKVYPCARYGTNSQYPLFDSLKKEKYFKNLSLFDNVKNPINTTTNPCEFVACKACELYQYCNAGCTWSQHDKKTDVFEPVSSVCELFKATYDQSYRIVDELKHVTNFKNYLRGMLKEKSLCL
jgi:uncharacterized protein